MNTSDLNPAPVPPESLADYIRRVRLGRGLSQRDVATRSGLHLQSIGKLERGQTTKVNRKAQGGLAYALQIPVEYLQALNKGESVAALPSLKFCPQCWVPGTPPENSWTDYRAQYCFLCGTAPLLSVQSVSGTDRLAPTSLLSLLRHGLQSPQGLILQRFAASDTSSL